MEGVYSSFRWVDEGHCTAAANTVSRENSAHVNVDNVDASGPGIRDSLLDGAIQAGCGVVDLGLEDSVRIALDKLKQERIASGHDKCVRRRSCHLRVQVSETPPKRALVSAFSRQEEIRQPYGSLALLQGSGRTRC